VLKAPYVLALAVAVATLVPVSIAFTPYGQEIEIGEQDVGVYDNADSRIEDARGDAQAVYQQSGTDPAPAVRDYHDILGASVARRGEFFLLTINLAGNPNNSENYETLYRWHIITTSPITGRDQQYTILFPHFSAGSSNSTNQGWYFVVYDETVNKFVRTPVKIQDMPEDRVEFPLEDFYIGAPTKFIYWVDVSVRLNATFGEPDYLMDYAPS
jgi:hypothetical protein